jgi:hypothetical protein
MMPFADDDSGESGLYKSKRRPLSCAALLPIPPVNLINSSIERVGFEAVTCQAPCIGSGLWKTPGAVLGAA